MKIQNKSKGVLLIRVGFVALIFLFVYLYRFSNSKISQLNPSATATTTPTSTSAPTMLIPTPYEKVENGVYTNYKYGIRFKYPNNIFITFINHAYENNDPKNKSHLVEFRDVPEDGYPVRKYNLRVYMAYDSKFVGSPAGFGLNFDDYYNRVVGAPLFSQDEEKTKVHNDIKVKNIKKDGYVGYISYDYLTESILKEGTSPSVSYSADILKNNLEIGFSISSPVVAEEDKYKVERLNLLENIINSLEFF